MRLVSVLLSGAASFTTTNNNNNIQKTTTTPLTFWNDAERVGKLSDPPPPSLLEKIQKNPWKGGLEPVPPQGIPLHTLELVEGSIPKDIQGVVCRNGAGRIRVGNSQYGHWFDGDGLVTKLSIDGAKQQATFSAQYVQTDRFLAQQKIQRSSKKMGNVPLAKSGAWTKRGTGKWWENLFAIPTNPANTNMMFINKKKNPNASPNPNDDKPSLYAICEGGMPYEIDPTTLETVGEVQFASPSSGELMKPFFSAHYSRDPMTGDIYNHGVQIGANPELNLVKLDPTGQMLLQKALKLPEVTLVHDHVISENYLILLLPPWLTLGFGSAMLKSLLAGTPLAHQFSWNPKGSSETTALVFSKDTLECVARIPLPLLSTYHLMDAYEKPDTNCLILRTLVHPEDSREEVEANFGDMYSAKDMPLCHLMEYQMDVASGQMLSSGRIAPQAAPCELPEVNSQWKSFRKQYVYVNTRQPGADHLDSLQKIDTESGIASDVISFGEGVYAGNPIFWPKPDAKTEDDGYLVTQLYRSHDHGSDVCILDAKTMEKLAIFRLNAHVPYQFHGAFHQGYPQTSD
jgi:all-trans-8'-apo-beta-carotenal 15,15'-oxygenase